MRATGDLATLSAEFHVYIKMYTCILYIGVITIFTSSHSSHNLNSVVSQPVFS